MSRYYKRGAKNMHNELETPHLYPGHGAALANQEGKFGENRHGKIYFIIHCSVCNYGICRYIEIHSAATDKSNVIMVDPCPNCARDEPEEIPHPIPKLT